MKHIIIFVLLLLCTNGCIKEQADKLQNHPLITTEVDKYGNNSRITFYMTDPSGVDIYKKSEKLIIVFPGQYKFDKSTQKNIQTFFSNCFYVDTKYLEDTYVIFSCLPGTKIYKEKSKNTLELIFEAPNK